MAAISSTRHEPTTTTVSTRLTMVVPQPTLPADDEDLIQLQQELKRAEAPIRYAKAEHNAACQASNVRIEEANQQRAILLELGKKKSPEGSTLWNAQIASQMAANRAQIAAGLVITTRTKLELLEGKRNAAQQALDDYVRDPRKFKLAREARERREVAEQRRREMGEARRREMEERKRRDVEERKRREVDDQRRREMAEKTQSESGAREMSQAARIAQIRQAAAEEARRLASLRGESCIPTENSHRKTPTKLPTHPRTSRPLPALPTATTTNPTTAKPTTAKPTTAKPTTTKSTTAKPTPPPPSPRPPNNNATPLSTWYTATQLAFTNYTTLTQIPPPPAPAKFPPCRNPACATSAAKLALGLCVDDLAQVFRELELPTFKDERLRWHPDRFVRCPEGKRERLQGCAKVVFQVVEGLYREELRGKVGKRG